MPDVVARIRELNERAERATLAASSRPVSDPRLDEAREAMREVIDLLGPLAEESPVEYKAQLAKAHGEYGQLLVHEDKPLAVASLNNAVNLLRELVNHGDAASMLDLINVLTTLAEWHLGTDAHRLQVFVDDHAGDQDALVRGEELLQEASQLLRSLGQFPGRLEPGTLETLGVEISQMLATSRSHRGDRQGAIGYGRYAEAALGRAKRYYPSSQEAGGGADDARAQPGLRAHNGR